MLLSIRIEYNFSGGIEHILSQFQLDSRLEKFNFYQGLEQNRNGEVFIFFLFENVCYYLYKIKLNMYDILVCYIGLIFCEGRQ